MRWPGHPPPLLLPTRDGQVQTLDERGLFLGFVPSAVYTTAAVPVGTGARLILYSDGVTETPAPDGDLFGIERLTAFASDERHQPCDAFANALMDFLQQFAGGEALPHDDGFRPRVAGGIGDTNGERVTYGWGITSNRCTQLGEQPLLRVS
jgi:sigma-B regulation protein RsbU (phosphoserine phosphatase)